MYAIVKQRLSASNDFYYSVVFGYYSNITGDEGSYAEYVQRIHSRYYVVLNKEKTGLVKKYVYEIENEYFDPMVLILDDSRDNWIVDESGCGCVDFLKNINLDDLPANVLEKCIAIDRAYPFEEIHSVNVQKDIKDFYAATGHLHDSAIAKLEKRNDELYVLMTGGWGCDVEIWFLGDVEYDVNALDPKKYDPTWYDCTLIIQGGMVYLINDENVKLEDITNDYSYFKAHSMKYKILPQFIFKKRPLEEISKVKRCLN